MGVEVNEGKAEEGSLGRIRLSKIMLTRERLRTVCLRG